MFNPSLTMPGFRPGPSLQTGATATQSHLPPKAADTVTFSGLFKRPAPPPPPPKPTVFDLDTTIDNAIANKKFSSLSALQDHWFKQLPDAININNKALLPGREFNEPSPVADLPASEQYAQLLARTQKRLELLKAQPANSLEGEWLQRAAQFEKIGKPDSPEVWKQVTLSLMTEREHYGIALINLEQQADPNLNAAIKTLEARYEHLTALQDHLWAKNPGKRLTPSVAQDTAE
jgi:hypothetical protein